MQGSGGIITPRGGDDDAVPARGGNGGSGFVCCGIFKYFLVRGVEDYQSLRANLVVNRGVVREPICFEESATPRLNCGIQNALEAPVCALCICLALSSVYTGTLTVS